MNLAWPDHLPVIEPVLSDQTLNELFCDHGCPGLEDWLAFNEAAVTTPALLREQA